MSMISLFSVAILVGVLTSVEGLQCNEGFNMSLGGIPFYHWKERTCNANSKCFGQELTANIGTKVVLRYGACLSSAYADLLDCNKLFGPDSTMDPADLLNLIPDIENRLNETIYDFVTGGIDEITKLFSSGTGVQEFVSGIYTFYESMGFNMEKARPLQVPMGDLFLALFEGNNTKTEQALMVFYTAFSNLDTADTKFTNNIYTFIGNFLNTTQIDSQIKTNIMLKSTIERAPGLIKSMFPAKWEASKWYDVIFDIMADVNIKNWKKTTQDIIATIKAAATIPQDVSDIMDPIFNTLPDLIDQVAKGNGSYAGYWSLELLKQYSERNTATNEFSGALITFVETLTGGATLQSEFQTMIQWMPGLFYKFFPADKTKIEDVYKKMAAGFNSFDFSNITNTAAPSKLSDFILTLSEKIMGSPLNATERLFIVNFSRMFYNLLSDYNTQLDKFFQVLITGFANFPTINAGTIISDLITEMGGQVPTQINPLLTNLQTIITSATARPYNPADLYTSFNTIIAVYKTSYPQSPFPELVERFITLIRNMTELRPINNDFATYMRKMNELQLELNGYWQIDLQFAIFNAMNYTTDEVVQAMVNAFPAYGTYIRFVQSLDAVDIKQLLKDVMTWIASGDLTGETFVTAIKPTVQVITSKMTSVLKELRQLFGPDSCKFGSCETDLCNDHKYIDDQVVYTKPTTTTPAATTTKPLTTTSSGGKISFSALLNVATMWLACNAFFG